MKSLNLAKPLVIITVGVPGAGKSFFARQFSETFAAPLVSVDYINYLLNGKLTDKEKKLVSGKLIDEQLLQLFKTQKTFIFDGGGASKAERLRIRKIAREHGYDTLLVWVQTDEATTKYRSLNRSAKRSGDAYNTSLTEAQYSLLTRQFSKPHATEPQVVISGKHTYATQAKVVLKKLVLPRENHLQNQPLMPHQGRTPASTSDASDERARRSFLIR